MKERNAILTSGDVISGGVNHPVIIKHFEINRVMGNQIYDVTMNNFPLLYSLQKFKYLLHKTQYETLYNKQAERVRNFVLYS